MKPALRLADYVAHMQQATAEAIAYFEDRDKDAFVEDRRTQQAVIFNLVILGEAASNVLSSHADFAQQHPEVPWRSIRATRNRMAHGYFDINLDVIWDHGTDGIAPIACCLAVGARSRQKRCGSRRAADRYRRFVNPSAG